MVRVGGGWKSLRDFCNSYEPEELKKLKFYNFGEVVNDKVGTPKSTKIMQLTPKNLSSSRSEQLFSTSTSKNLKVFKDKESKFGLSPSKK